MTFIIGLIVGGNIGFFIAFVLFQQGRNERGTND